MAAKLLLGCVCVLSTVVLNAAQNFEVTFSIQEELDRQSFVGNVTDAAGFMDFIPVEDRDHLLFSFLSQTNYKSMLSIHYQTGTLRTTVVIDRESIEECRVPAPCELSFNIAARSQRKDSPLFEIISVTVIIEDINDNSPTFPKATQVIEISETAVNGTPSFVESANDDDAGANSIQYYTLVGNTGLFAVDVERKLDGSMSVRLLVMGKLDREVRDFYTCTLIARDGGATPKSGSMKLNITIKDENDNAPVFLQTSYNVTVQESATYGTSIAQITATDSDIGPNAELRYRFSQHQSDLEHLTSLFFINEYTGEISVVGTLVYQPGKVYQIIVEAIDQGSPPLLSTNQAVVTVNIQDTGNNKPVIQINLLSTGSGRVKNMSEISGRGTFVAHVEAIDSDTGDNGNVTCRVKGSLFSMESLSNNGFKVVVAGNLDRESEDLHTVIIVCNDFGKPVLSSSASFLVRVTDENDNTPHFTQQHYVEDFYENNDKGDRVLSVLATDLDSGNNSKIEYSLENTVKNYFAIERNSGNIKARVRFDRENQTSWTFLVFATDKGKEPQTGNATVTVRIKDLNDNPPKFTNSTFYFTVRENLPSGTVVDRLTATDSDYDKNAKFAYAISEYTGERLPFLLLPRDGEIKTTRELDREEKSRYSFTVIARDEGSPKLTSSAYVVINIVDQNDLSPRIVFPREDNDTVTIAHLKQSGSYVTQIEAYDGDVGVNSKLSYVIEEGNADRLFLLNLNTGVLSMAQMHEVAENQEEKYLLVIAVHDGGIEQRSKRCVLNVVIKYSNETVSSVTAPTGSGTNTNIVIVIVVILLTFCLSVAIIIVICVIRKLDRNRMKGQDIQINKLPNNMTEIRDNSNGTVGSRQYDKFDTLRKKKEVSFSFDDDFDGLRDHEISFSNNSVFMDNTSEMPHHHDRLPSQPLKTFQHKQQYPQHPAQSQAMLGSHPKPWGPAHTKKPLENKSNEKDNNSDTSRETVTSDSGRGGSDDDFPITHDISRDERDISNVLKCTLPLRDIHTGSMLTHSGSGGRQSYPALPPPDGHARPHSSDLTDRIPHKNNIDRSLTSLVGGEKPKFTVRQPYIDRDGRDKKSDSWVPSYV